MKEEERGKLFIVPESLWYRPLDMFTGPDE
jgi:hypothetical protein